MKKINWLMMLMMACVMSFVACTEPDQPDEPTPPTPEGLTFDVQIGDVTSSSIEFVVTPSDLEAEYLCVLYNAEIVEDFTLDKYLVATLYQDLEAEARAMGMTFEEYVAEFTDKGILEGTYSPLSPATDYYLIVFGVDPNNGYEANTEVSKTKVSTLEIVKVDVTFDVQTTVDENTAYFNVKPSDNEVYWYFNTLPTSTYQAYTDPEGAYYVMLDISEFGYENDLTFCEDLAAKVAATWTEAGAACSYGNHRFDGKSGLYSLSVLGVWKTTAENSAEETA
jgi:hypothetical protein